MTDETHHRLPPELLAALRTPAAVDSVVSDAHIDRALALFDSMGSADDGRDRGAPVIPLRAQRRPARWLAAAAAIVVVAGGVWLAGRGGPAAPVQSADRAAESTFSTTTVRSPRSAKSVGPSPSPAPAEQGVASSSPAAASFGSADSAASPPSTAASGVSDSQLALPDTRDQGATAGQLATTSTEPATSCRAPRLRSALISIGTTTVDGEPRLLLIYVSGPEGQIITRVLLDPTTCARS